ncbi:Transient receptor potential cation channel subfamily A member 1 [Paramuricea clavata]|uniref:Transient receptor potential cation channel subfamily A member 1 n=1 Tax=Paramuricea clavata TaxID=317549 RepID=A0A7D9E0K4_PARCT|nr:Transient receptor potential cation channel subfamily A member 1 [Paramuricea clavata]
MKEDVLCVTGEPECCFMLYEQKHIQHLLHSLQKAKEILELEKVHVEPAEILLGNELTGVDIIIQLTEGLQKALDDLQTKSGDSLWNIYEELTNLEKKLLQKISEYKLAPVKPNILELTVGGPGVRVSNFEVRFRDAEIAMLHKSDRRTRIHRATNDLQKKRLAEDEVAEMSLKEVEEFENNRMVKNAWRVAEEVHIRINGEPAPKGFIASAVSERPGVEFFYNKEWLMKYNITSTTKWPEVPGHSYFQKIEKFFEMHYERGELYMEFLKKDCLSKVGRSCNACTEWIGPDDYDWEKLYKTGRLKNLRVCELDKYVQHYKLTTRKLTKAEKLQLLSARISQRICQKIISNAKATTSQAPFSQSEHDSQSSSSSQESSSDDEVPNVFGGYSREHDSFGDVIMDEDSDEDDFPVREITVNRYGRKVGSWRSRCTQDE